eukprot:NODE_2419_length_929_cov_34.529545_g1989_i0.p1 GENE.NODE_2419_length_929_cov_34.529545_g1989_i0~~NODE_2419_length_929_cov_34.529545_g1989_i0.p1  ORF type:complete len:284 (-),score=67.75 NODE_2419_length_929_cov_34.529545_g1989_i0:22-873(-)
MQLLRYLRPAYWFSAHNHVKFAAIMPHPTQPPQPVPTDLGPNFATQRTGWRPESDQPAGEPKEPLEEPWSPAVITKGTSNGESGLPFIFPVATEKATRFLALDKCLPRRRYLQVVDLDLPSSSELHYDLEWLVILKMAQRYFPVSLNRSPSGPFTKLKSDLQDKEMVRKTREWLLKRAAEHADGKYANLKVPLNFVDATQSAFEATDNPQTREFLEFMDITDNVIASDMAKPFPASAVDEDPAAKRQCREEPSSNTDPSEIALDGDMFFTCTCVGACVCGASA